MGDSVSVKFDSSKVMAGIDDLFERAKAATRPAAQTGAQVFYDEVKLNVQPPRIGIKTGNLSNSIYQVYSKDNSNEARAEYHISWNHAKAPHGHLVEYGHIQTHKVYIGSDGNWYTSKELLPEPKQVGARPFVRPAFGKAGQALAAAERAYFERLNRP